jgi:hypothetical protein
MKNMKTYSEKQLINALYSVLPQLKKANDKGVQFTTPELCKSAAVEYFNLYFNRENLLTEDTISSYTIIKAAMTDLNTFGELKYISMKDKCLSAIHTFSEEIQNNNLQPLSITDTSEGFYIDLDIFNYSFKNGNKEYILFELEYNDKDNKFKLRLDFCSTQSKEPKNECYKVEYYDLSPHYNSKIHFSLFELLNNVELKQDVINSSVIELDLFLLRECEINVNKKVNYLIREITDTKGKILPKNTVTLTK